MATNASLIGPYRILGRLGEGGFGIVHRAEQLRPVRRMVALKVVKPGMATEDVVRRFEAERQALALMDHPHIAKVFDAGETQDRRPYFVMELVEGEPVTTFCDARQLGIRERLTLFVKVCAAVQHAHQKAVLHRDLKPSNILVAEQDGQPVPKVIDFGIAKALEQPLTDHTLFTAQGLLVGTPHYMSPEQAGATGDVDTRSDIYSLGVILYELLTGRLPLEPQRLRKAPVDEVCRLIREEEPVRPSSKVAQLGVEGTSSAASHGMDTTQRWQRDLRGELDWIVMRCLEKNRERRYETVGTLLADLECHLRDDPVSARPPSVSYRLGKLMRRHRGPVLATTAVMGTLLLGILASLWQLRITRAALRDVESERQKAGSEASRRRQMLMTASRSDVARAAQLLMEADASNEKLPEALAHLRRALLFDEKNTDAAELALQSLLWHAQAPSSPQFIRAIAGPSPFKAAMFSPDGNQVLAFGGKSVVLHHISQPRANPVNLLHEAEVTCAAFSADGTRVITGTEDGAARLWQVSDGANVGLPMKHRGSVRAVAFRPDGRVVVTASDDGAARLWDTRTGAAAGQVMRHEAAVVSVAFHPGGGLVLTASEDHTARLWDSSNGNPMGSAFAHETMVRGAGFLRDGLTLYTWGEDNSMRVWATDGTGSARVLPHETRLLAVQPAPDGKMLATMATNGGVTLWDATTGGLMRTLAGRAPLRCMAHSPDGCWIAAGGDDGAVRLWSVFTGEFVGQPFHHGAAVVSVHFSPDGSLLLSASPDGVMRLWNIPVANPCGLRLTGAVAVNRVHFTSKGLSVIASAGADTAQVWDAPTGQRIGPAFEGSQSGPAGTSQGSSPITSDGSRVLRIMENTAQVFDVASGRAVGEPLQAGDAWIRMAAFSPDGTRVFTVMDDNILRIWDLTTGHQVGAGLQHPSDITSASYSPDGGLLVTSAVDGSVRVWDANAATLKFPPLHHDRTVFCARFSPDGRFIVTASMDKTARLWDTRTGKSVGSEISHRSPVLSAEFNHASTKVVTTSLERETSVWDVEFVLPESRQRVPAGLPVDPARVTRITHGALMSRAVFSPDGRWILTEPDAGASLVQPDSKADRQEHPVILWGSSTGTAMVPATFAPALLQADFSADGCWLASVHFNGEAWVREVVPAQTTVDRGLPEFLEMVAGRELTEDGHIRLLSTEELLHPERRSRTADSHQTAVSDGPYQHRFMQWWRQSPRTRTLSPSSDIKVARWIEDALTPLSQPSGQPQESQLVLRAYSLDPLHPLVHIALAEIHPARADLLRRHGVRQRLMDPANEALYGTDTWARYARLATRMLLTQAARLNTPPDDSTVLRRFFNPLIVEAAQRDARELATESLALARRLAPNDPGLTALEALLQSR